MLDKAVAKLVERKDLTREEAEESMKEIMSGASPVLVSSFLTALSMKGETGEEIASLAKVMRDFSVKIKPDVGNLLDTCGTGGDVIKTFNISTLSALVCSCYTPIAKHGNRSVTSKCGSADMLESFGVKIDCSPEITKKCIEKIGIGFLFAPLYHPAMKNVVPIRKELGIRTVFNILGPLTNPAGAKKQVIGVYEKGLCKKMAQALRELGVEGTVLHGSGLDEVSISDVTYISEVKNSEIKDYLLKPEDFGLKKTDSKEIIVSGKEESLKASLEILKSQRGAKQDIVCMNSSLSLLTAGFCDDLKKGMELSREALESGKALKQLRSLINETGGDITKLNTC